MPRRIPIKNETQEGQVFTRRAIVALVGAITLLMIVVGRLLYLQVVNHELYTTLSRDNRVKIVPIPPTRGLIYDRNGKLLAENVPAFSLEVIPEQVEDMKETLGALSAIVDISENDIEHFYGLLEQKRRFEGVPIRYRLSEEEVARFAVNRHRFQGVDIHARLVRYYPLGELGSHVVGYVGRIDEQELSKVDVSNYSATTHIGKVGIEKSYEEALHGKVGYQQVEVNAQGRKLRVLNRTPPVPGRNVHLNIDIELQATAFRALDTYRGAVVALDPRSGEVLALVSKPGYDPNLFVNGIDKDTYNQLRSSGSQPLFNRALRGQYPPGSTIKPFLGLAGLEHRVASNGHSVFCPGWYMLKGDDRRYRDWKKGGHGVTNLNKAIVQSCDVYFYELAVALGIDRMYGFMKKFGFGQKTGIDIVGERPGLFPSRQWKNRERHLPWFPGETVITGIGQGFTLVTPLQLATATAAIAQHGIRRSPMVLNTIQATDAETSPPEEPRSPPPVGLRNSHHWSLIIDAMTEVVHGKRGTARRINHGLEYRVAGKTGTAQVFGMEEDEEYEEEEIAARLRDHSLFIAFAPVDDPRIAIAVVAENAGSGSSVAAPIARKVMDYYLMGPRS